jgi:predicted alpha/beta superfamily hydrolase
MNLLNRCQNIIIMANIPSTFQNYALQSPSLVWKFFIAENIKAWYAVNNLNRFNY